MTAIDELKKRAEYYRSREEYTKIDVLQQMVYDWECWEYGNKESVDVAKSVKRGKSVGITALWIRRFYHLLGQGNAARGNL